MEHRRHAKVPVRQRGLGHLAQRAEDPRQRGADPGARRRGRRQHRAGDGDGHRRGDLRTEAGAGLHHRRGGARLPAERDPAAGGDLQHHRQHPRRFPRRHPHLARRRTGIAGPCAEQPGERRGTRSPDLHRAGRRHAGPQHDLLCGGLQHPRHLHPDAAQGGGGRRGHRGPGRMEHRRQAGRDRPCRHDPRRRAAEAPRPGPRGAAAGRGQRRRGRQPRADPGSGGRGDRAGAGGAGLHHRADLRRLRAGVGAGAVRQLQRHERICVSTHLAGIFGRPGY